VSDLLQPGQIFAERYRIERFLARGGMGAVFVAEQLATEKRSAVKVLWPHVLGTRTAREKFELEARVAARVNSEYIVEVFDAGVDAKTELPFLVMELLDGQSLQDVVESSGALAPETVARYMLQLAMGLDKAHGYVGKDGAARPIVHRDLKPENMFLTRRENGEPLVKILDFGIAKVVSETTAVSQEVKGTPLYMAYEQVHGQAVTPGTDVWAMGLIAFFLLSGLPYWKSASNPDAGLPALFGEVLTADLVPPSERLRELGGTPSWLEPFDTWFAQCVNRDASARFASAGLAAHALAEALVGAEAARLLPEYRPPAVTSSGTVVMADQSSVSAKDVERPAAAPSRTAGPAGSTEDKMALAQAVPAQSSSEAPNPSKLRLGLVVAAVLGVAAAGAAWAVGAHSKEAAIAESAEPSDSVPAPVAASSAPVASESARAAAVPATPSALPLASSAEPAPVVAKSRRGPPSAAAKPDAGGAKPDPGAATPKATATAAITASPAPNPKPTASGNPYEGDRK